MRGRLVHGAFSAGRSLLASRTEVLLVNASLQVHGTWRPAQGDAVCAIALSENGEQAAIATESDRVVVWSTQTLTARVLLEANRSPEEKLMAAMLGQEIDLPAAQLAVANDGETVALVRAGAGGAYTLELLGPARARVEVGSIDPWTRVSMHEELVVLGRSAYAREDLARLPLGEEVFARSNGVKLVRTSEGEIALRAADATTSLGEWDDAGFASHEVVLVRLRQHKERGPRSLEVQRWPLAPGVIETRSIPWDAPDRSDPFGERAPLCDCANLRGVVHAGEAHAWVDLRTGERIGDVEARDMD
ncbi:hypothetical protein [Nannocystis bainbridge]|uniref:Uncharacterized protein n=1 Tax=Nannocystis bainbridge TaxID=2995303 RepID=A0ABT5EF61_9BACT|nr:hypothetical protein [Nannocystis bainbridge]MDC0723452.1 hypothetical protein [Nannocystis bainbridge]